MGNQVKAAPMMRRVFLVAAAALTMGRHAEGIACPPLSYSAGVHELYMHLGGIERTYLLYVPQSLQTSQPVPLLLLTPGTGNPARPFLQNWPNLLSFAEQKQFLIVVLVGSLNKLNVEFQSLPDAKRPDDM